MAKTIEYLQINGVTYEFPKGGGGGTEVDLTEVNNKINEKLAKTTFETYTSTTRDDIISLENNKANKSEAVGSAKYNSKEQTIDFYSVKGDKLNTSIDASVFLMNGMVESVEITKGSGNNTGEDVLRIVWNTAAGQEPIEIPLSDIFNADNYYTKKEIDDKVKVFETYEEYDEAIKNLTDIYFIEETKTIAYNGVEYAASNTWKIFDEPESEFMDIAVFNKSTSQLEVYSDLELNELSSVDNLVPIGVVVIPKSHDVYGDGSCGVMSLVSMSLETPEVGNVGQKDVTIDTEKYMMTIGSSSNGLTAHEFVPHLGSIGLGALYNNVQGQCNQKDHLPTDYIGENMGNGIICPTDIVAKYPSTTDTDRYFAPSPYDGKGRNEIYYTDSDKCEDNALKYFDGKGNTEKMLSKATGQSTWKTDSTIKDSADSGYFPAACCCWRFHTEGTSNGDWYLPTIGELGYVGVRYSKILDTIDYINEKFNGEYATKIAFTPSSVQNIWSSSFRTSSSFFCLSTMNASIANKSVGTGNKAQVRAFLKLKY